MNTSPIRVLHVDDDPGLLELTGELLKRENDRFVIETATSTDEGLEVLADRPPHCIISDYDMPGQNGIEFLREVREDSPELPFILFTGKGSEEIAGRAISAGVTDYLQKGTGTEQYELLANRIENAVQAQHAAREAVRNKELMRLTEVVGDTGGWELDLETKKLDLTKGAQRLLNLSDDSLAFEELFDLFHPDDRDQIRGALDRAEAGEQVQRTWRVLTDDGDQQFLDINLAPVSSNGDVTTLRGAVNDATDRYERGKELKQIIEAVPGCVVKLNADGEFIFANKRSEEVLGLDSEEVIGRTYNDPEWNLRNQKSDSIPDEELPFQRIQKTGQPVRDERLDIEWPDGTRKLLLVNGAPIFSEDGSFESAVFSLVDVTESRERQQELRLLQQAIDDVCIAITLVDPSQDDNPLVYVNDAYEELTGYAKKEALGRCCWHLQGKGTDTDAVSALQKVVDTEAQTTAELRNYRKDGTEFWNRLSMTPIYDDNDDIIRYLCTHEDVTKRKEREQCLEETKRQLQAVLDTVNASIVIKDVQGRYRYANDEARENLGVDADEDITGLTDYDLLPTDLADQYRADDQRVTEAGETFELEEEVPTPKGPQIYRTFKSPFYDADGELIGVCAVSTEITEHKERERKLIQAKELISKMEHLAGIGAWEYDPEDDELTNTAGTKRIYEVEPEAELTVEETFEFFKSGDRDRLRDRFETCLETGESYEIDVRVVTADGNQKWVTAHGERTETQSGDLIVRGYVQDITAQKERFTQLEQTETLFQNAQDMLFIMKHTDGKFVVKRVNKAFERATGLSNEQLQGKTPREVFGTERGRQIERRYQQCIDNDKPVSYEETVEAQKIPNVDAPDSAEDTYWETRIAPVEADDKQWVVGASRDMNEQKRRERELKQKNERLEEFASVVSHDLKNPLQVATGRLELAQADCTSAHLDDVADALERMGALIDDLLTLAHSGETVGSVETVSLPSLIEECWEVVPSENATMVIETDQTISADRSSLRQLLENLLANAVEHGGEEVTVRVDNLTGGFYIADDGPGIPEGEREDVFNAGYSTAEEGTGFGLRITEEVADAHGWDIQVTDSDDGGAQFEITGIETSEQDMSLW